jgi:hypothetical protein
LFPGVAGEMAPRVRYDGEIRGLIDSIADFLGWIFFHVLIKIVCVRACLCKWLHQRTALSSKDTSIKQIQLLGGGGLKTQSPELEIRVVSYIIHLHYT